MSTIGTPTEIALLFAAAKSGRHKEDITRQRLEEMPFSSERKMMSALYQDGADHRYIVYAKGAPEMLLLKCTKIQVGDEVRVLSAKDKEEIGKLNDSLTGNAYRTLATAYKVTNDTMYEENDFIYLGLLAMEDPPREEVAHAIAQANQAGIAVKMITGDNKETATAIGKQIGLTGALLTGAEIDQLNDDQLRDKVNDTVLFARVRPEHKLRIVHALQQLGNVVTMTGDGVNDAPALKEAQIGVAMGKNGTDVARSVADMTLKDDNFATIIAAISEGRSIFNNIRKFISYQLSCNLAELSILFVGVLLAPLFGWQIPILLALQILFMNLITDNLPAITLGLNPASKDIMRQKPRKETGLLNGRLIAIILFTAATMATLTLVAYSISLNVLGQSPGTARTTALVSLILIEIASAFNFRSFRQLVLTRSLFVNKYLFIASTLSLIATICIIYTPLRSAFEVIPLSLNSWIIALVAALTIVIIYDLLKLTKAFASFSKIR